MSAVQRSAVVVGAGLAGLSAAYRLQQAGFAVTVIERRHRPGGRVKTLRQDGFVIDAGPDAMTSGYRGYLDLCAELGLAQEIVPSSRVIGTVRDGRVIDIDPQRPLSALFTRALSWPAKLRLVWGLWRMRKLFSGIDSFKLIESADLDDEHETAQQFGERYFGREATDYLIDPLMRLTVGSGAAQCSRLGVLGGLLSWSVQLINIKGGLDVLPRALAARLPVRFGAEVEQLQETDAGVEIRYRDANGQTQKLHADVAVIATTYNVAEQIYSPLRQLAPDYLEALHWVRLISVSLAYRHPTRSQAYAVQVPTVEKPDVLLIFLQHNKAPDRVPPGCSLITLYTDTLATPRMLQQSDEAITQWARGEIETLFPELAGHLASTAVSRWPIAGYLATPGFWRRTRALHQALPASSRVQLAGDLFGAGSMESAVQWGARAAQTLIAQDGARASPAASGH